MRNIAFTDGASSGNPGPGGWAVVFVYEKEGKEFVREAGGGEALTTNNRMELAAALEAMSLAKGAGCSSLTIYTDSRYLVNGATKWINDWVKNGWKTKGKEDVLNRDNWEVINAGLKDIDVQFEYIGGHAGISGNERADDIAVAFSKEKKLQLFSGLLCDYQTKNIRLAALGGTRSAKKKSIKRHESPYSYVSSVDGIVFTHANWEDCEKRVKGVRGVKYKKVYSKQEEADLIAEWGNKKSTFTVRALQD
ncbi:MAG: hypothetical protein A2928_01360 [Candidatus Taylorbacteria bacterium RIFCSPLOWO2_01_FULL_45_15b]|uniref:ribonuclease H n=1 Tax=Candidatus Taylorbacteria bacterium RIFCSPLOWO2_01_FULL_45_15b TaxID=1802319 RepID=A0A1G2NA32_9BACT|nr:MAG: hypothetical protein A2928_01360 [Candidatus Taylorbacteria bacterium RIFCSPLOWO2_01_FULL_45_15b]